MPFPEKPAPAQETKLEGETMECEQSPAGDESNMNTDGRLGQQRSQDSSNSSRNAESMAVEATESKNSPGSPLADPLSSPGTVEPVQSEDAECLGNPQAGLQEPEKAVKTELPQIGKETESDQKKRPDLKELGSSPGAEGIKSPERPRTRGRIAQTFSSIAQRITPRRRHSASPEQKGVISPKSKGKPRTPKGSKSPGTPLSPGSSTSLSPEEQTGSRDGSLKHGKRSFFQKLLSPMKDTKGDQKAPRSFSFPEDDSESSCLTEPTDPAPVVAKSKGLKFKDFFIRKSDSGDSTAATEDSQDCLHAKEPKGGPEDRSDSTVSLSLSPVSERRESEFEANFEANFGVQAPLQTDEQNVSYSGPTSEAESGAGSGNASVVQQETEANISGETSISKETTGSGATADESSVVPPEMETDDAPAFTISGEVSTAESKMETEKTSRQSSVEEAEMETEDATGTSTDSVAATGTEPEAENVTQQGMETEEANDDGQSPGESPGIPTIAFKVDDESQPSPCKRSKTEE